MRKYVLLLVAAALVFIAGGYAVGASTVKTIYSCVSTSTGSLTKVSVKMPKCPKGSSLLSWNQIGPQGLSGKQGAAGVPGLPGPKGDQGESSGYFIKSGANFHKVWVDPFGRDAVKIDGVWWAIIDEDIDPPYIRIGAPDNTYGANVELGDVFVYRDLNCQGTKRGYLMTYRGGDNSNISSFPLSYNNVAIKMFGSHYSVSFSTTKIGDVRSYSNGVSCTNGKPSRSSWSTYRVYEMRTVLLPSLVFDSPIELR